MADVVRVAAVQLSAVGCRDEADPLERALAGIHEAARQGAKLIVLPESTWPGWVVSSRAAFDATCSRQKRTFEMVTAAFSQAASAARAAVIVGLMEPAVLPDGQAPGPRSLANAAYCFDADGWLRGVARKRLLWDGDQSCCTAGAEPCVVTFPAAGLADVPVGVLICADGRQPEIAAGLVRRGAKVLAVPTAWVTATADGETLYNVQAEFMAATRARECRVPLVATSKTGREADLVHYAGRSGVLDADGQWVARAGQDGEAVCVADVFPGETPPNVIWTIAPRTQAVLERGPDKAALAAIPRAADLRVALVPGVAMLERQVRNDRPDLLADLAANGVQVVVLNPSRESEVQPWRVAAAEIPPTANLAGTGLTVVGWPTAEFLAVTPRGATAPARVALLSQIQVQTYPVLRAAAFEGAVAAVVFDAAEERLPLLRTRAVENGVFVLAVGAMWAAVIRPDGSVSRTRRDAASVLTARLPLALAADKTTGLATDPFAQWTPA